MLFKLAERKGFEPLTGFPIPLFESGQFNHSCISPYHILFYYTISKTSFQSGASLFIHEKM